MLPPLLPLLVLPGPPLFLASAAGKVFMFMLALERTLVDDGPEDVPARRGLGAINNYALYVGGVVGVCGIC